MVFKIQPASFSLPQNLGIVPQSFCPVFLARVSLLGIAEESEECGNVSVPSP